MRKVERRCDLAFIEGGVADASEDFGDLEMMSMHFGTEERSFIVVCAGWGRGAWVRLERKGGRTKKRGKEKTRVGLAFPCSLSGGLGEKSKTSTTTDRSASFNLYFSLRRSFTVTILKCGLYRVTILFGTCSIPILAYVCQMIGMRELGDETAGAECMRLKPAPLLSLRPGVFTYRRRKRLTMERISRISSACFVGMWEGLLLIVQSCVLN
jgi:hypothetical protein